MIFKCKHCGEQITKKELIFYLLVALCGGTVHPDPFYCPDTPNHKHDWKEVSED